MMNLSVNSIPRVLRAFLASLTSVCSVILPNIAPRKLKPMKLKNHHNPHESEFTDRFMQLLRKTLGYSSLVMATIIFPFTLHGIFDDTDSFLYQPSRGFNAVNQESMDDELDTDITLFDAHAFLEPSFDTASFTQRYLAWRTHDDFEGVETETTADPYRLHFNSINGELYSLTDSTPSHTLIAWDHLIEGEILSLGSPEYLASLFDTLAFTEPLGNPLASAPNSTLSPGSTDFEGNRFLSAVSNFFESSSWDLSDFFSAIFSSQAVAIPEPNTYIILGLFLLATMSMQHLRDKKLTNQKKSLR